MAKRSNSSRNHASTTLDLTPQEQRQWNRSKKSDAIDLANDTGGIRGGSKKRKAK